MRKEVFCLQYGHPEAKFISFSKYFLCMNKIKSYILSEASKALGIKDIELETPPKPELGDYAVHCYKLSKSLKKQPRDIMEILLGKIKKSHYISDIKQIGPYVNFFVNNHFLAEDTLRRIIAEKERFGSSLIGSKKKVLIEHTSINPNASPHVGRARNAIIGDSITRILRFNGYDVEVHYFVNDVGKQIAMLVLGCRNKKVSFSKLLDIYVDINEKAESNPEIEKEVLSILSSLEHGDKDIVKIFKDVVDICIKGQVEILSQLGIKYDFFDYESKYLWNKQTEKILAMLKKTGKLFEDDEGRLVVNLKGYELGIDSPVIVLTRADKTSLYPLRDIAYTLEKISKKCERNILILGEDQKLYFQQLKAVLDILGHKAPEIVHYSFVLLQDSDENEKAVKMSTREGNVVLLEDFLKEAFAKAENEVNKRLQENEKDTRKIAMMIANSAIKYSILKVSPEKNVMFNLGKALSFEGDTGPYLLYAHVRMNSIIEKFGRDIPVDADFKGLVSSQEAELVKLLGEFPDIVEKALEQLRPHLVANYLYHLAQSFNDFYHNCHVISTDEKLTDARIVLVNCSRYVLANGLRILGIEPVERM